MSEKSDSKDIRPTSESTALSAGALKTGLRLAAKAALSVDETDRAREDHIYLKPLSDESVRIAIKKPPMWEYRLYFQALKDFVARHAGKAAKPATPSRGMDYLAALDWIQGRFDEYLGLVNTIDDLVNRDLQHAFGMPGEDGDAAAIVAVARKVAGIYHRFLTIREEALTSQVVPAIENMFRAFGRICDGSIEEFESYPTKSLNTLMQTLASATEDTDVVLHFEMELKADTKEFDRELRKARMRYDHM